MNFIESRKELHANVVRDVHTLEHIVRNANKNVGVLPFVRMDGEMQQYVVTPTKIFGFKVIANSIEEDINRGEDLVYDPEISQMIVETLVFEAGESLKAIREST